VDYRRVKVGRIHDGLRVILPPEYKVEDGKKVFVHGLEPSERVVVNGLQRVRPGVEVRPQLVEMRALSDPGQRDKETRRPGDKETKNSKDRP
jgi:hypothetical protein